MKTDGKSPSYQHLSVCVRSRTVIGRWEPGTNSERWFMTVFLLWRKGVIKQGLECGPGTVTGRTVLGNRKHATHTPFFAMFLFFQALSAQHKTYSCAANCYHHHHHHKAEECSEQFQSLWNAQKSECPKFMPPFNNEMFGLTPVFFLHCQWARCKTVNTSMNWVRKHAVLDI